LLSISKEAGSYSSISNGNNSNNNQSSENNFGDEYENFINCNENFSENFYDSFLKEIK